MFNLQKFKEWSEKSKIGLIPLLLLLLGFGLLFLPNILNSSGSDNGKISEKSSESIFDSSNIENLEKRLCELLAQIEGVGRIDVMLTMESNGETVYVKDIRKSSDVSKNEFSEQTVIINDSDRSQNALIEQEIYPQVRGAAVVCDGADNPVTASKIIETIKAVFGIPANRISVVKKQ